MLNCNNGLLSIKNLSKKIISVIVFDVIYIYICARLGQNWNRLPHRVSSTYLDKLSIMCIFDYFLVFRTPKSRARAEVSTEEMPAGHCPNPCLNSKLCLTYFEARRIFGPESFLDRKIFRKFQEIVSRLTAHFSSVYR